MKKPLSTLCIAIFVFCLQASAEFKYSGGEIIPGEWNTRYYACKAYAEEHNLPFILFWANPGCSQCARLEKACGEDGFIKWAKGSGYIFCFVNGDSSAENADAKSFAFNSSREFPYICVYWKKADGTTIKRNFTGRKDTLPSKEGDDLHIRFINSIESSLNGVAPSPHTDTVETFGTEWNRTRKINGIVKETDGTITGTISVSFGKANKKTGVATVKAQYVPFSGKKLNFSAKVSAYDNQIELLARNGRMQLKVKPNEFDGIAVWNSGIELYVASSSLGGALSLGEHSFELLSYPEAYGTFPVLKEFLPLIIQSTGSKLDFGKRGTVKLNRTTQFFEATTSNPSGLKLSYSSKTGLFKGSYVTYVQTAATKVKKITTKVQGVVVNGHGSGVATAKGLASAKVSLE